MIDCFSLTSQTTSRVSCFLLSDGCSWQACCRYVALLAFPDRVQLAGLL
jgi:hypothetical protein